MVHNTRLETKTEICDIKSQTADVFEEFMSHDYETYTRKQGRFVMGASEQVQSQTTA